MVVTAAAAVRFRAPVPLGVPLSVRAQVRSKRGKILRVEGTIHSAAGALLASAQGSFASLGPLEAQRFGNSGAREPV
jgi:acyl-CoA thioesterase FadM